MQIFWYGGKLTRPDTYLEKHCLVVLPGEKPDMYRDRDGCLVWHGNTQVVVPLARIEFAFFPLMNLSVVSHCAFFLQRHKEVVDVLYDLFVWKASARYTPPTEHRRANLALVQKLLSQWEKSLRLPSAPVAGDMDNVTHWVTELIDMSHSALAQARRLPPLARPLSASKPHKKNCGAPVSSCHHH